MPILSKAIVETRAADLAARADEFIGEPFTFRTPMGQPAIITRMIFDKDAFYINDSVFVHSEIRSMTVDDDGFSIYVRDIGSFRCGID